MELSLKLATYSNKASLDRPCILSDQHGLKLDISSRNIRKLTNAWKVHSSLLNEKWAKKEIKKEIKDFSRIGTNIQDA